MPHEVGQYLVCGSGNQAAAVRKEFAKQRFLQIDVGLQPGVLRSFMGNDSGELPPELQHLVHSPEQPSNWHLGTTTPVMQNIARQILQCPYQGISRRIELESKALQLLALLVEREIEMRTGQRQISSLNPDQFERIHRVEEILRSQIHNRPSLEQLARQVGLNECTLKQGFRQVFGKTVFTYFRDYQLEQAQQLLVTGNFKVEEVAQMVGYGDRSAFTKAFRRKFNISPSYCRRAIQYF
ncbi:MAG: AraC family transcriptional regulator [Nostoc sp.]|uniref:helix-turn-helix transcriptional regulator n=1 Tax=Nostoc sp. TaxID=1180 RepID=UPI002FF7B7CD